MSVALVEVGGAALAHLGVNFVQFEQQLVDFVVQRLCVQPDAPASRSVMG